MTLDQNFGYFLLLVGIAKALARYYKEIGIHQTGYAFGVRSVRISEGAAFRDQETMRLARPSQGGAMAQEDDQAAAPITSQLPVPAIYNHQRAFLTTPVITTIAEQPREDH